MSAAFADDDTSLSGANTAATTGANGRTPPAAVDIGSLHLLIYSYLLHNNCGRTAKAFARTCGLATSGSLTSGSAPSFLASLPAPADAETSDDEEEEDEYVDADSQCAADSSAAASLKHKQRQQQQRDEVGAVSAVVLGKRPVSSGRMAIDGDDDDDILPSASADSAGAGAGAGIREGSFLDDASDASQECMENDDDGIGASAPTTVASAAAGIGSRGGSGLDYMHGALPSGGVAIAPGNAVAAASESEVERANRLIDHHIECLRIRQSICSSIEAGEPKVALDLLATYFRDVLIPPPAESLAVSPLPLRSEFDATLLRFRLDTQHYVELIAKHQELDALIFGQRTLWRYPDIFDTWLNHSLDLASAAGSGGSYSMVSGQQASGVRRDRHLRQQGAARKAGPASHQTLSRTPQQKQQRQLFQRAVAGDTVVPREELKLKRAEIMQHITNVAALVAYQDPHKSILAYLLSQDRRDELAGSVNAAILRALQFPREPAMVTLVRQLATTSACLVGYPTASLAASSGGGARPPPPTSSAAAAGGGLENLLGAAQELGGNEAPGARMNHPWALGMFVNSDTSADEFVL
ncbi:hypothetical protein GGI11_004679 [Coemansia sp. RSA 2049]|nr:hypothetical protein GGI11_004679 [Coemansia sp. RSA 2049]